VTCYCDGGSVESALKRRDTGFDVGKVVNDKLISSTRERQWRGAPGVVAGRERDLELR